VDKTFAIKVATVLPNLGVKHDIDFFFDHCIYGLRQIRIAVGVVQKQLRTWSRWIVEGAACGQAVNNLCQLCSMYGFSHGVATTLNDFSVWRQGGAYALLHPRKTIVEDSDFEVLTAKSLRVIAMKVLLKFDGFQIGKRVEAF